MWITDGSGNALYGSQATPIGGALSGTFESTDGTILIYVDSDSSLNYSMTFEFSCYDPPSCIAPTGLSARATSPTEATVSWTAGDSETAWEYVVQVAGTGEPTGAGTATTTNPLSLSGLTSNTAYEIYLRADCGDDYSGWVSTTFTTGPGCGDTVTHCYTSGVYKIFDSSVDNAGDYITVTINAGDTESGYDGLVIFDSLDSSGNALYNIDGDHSGQVVTSTTGLISVWINVDASRNCTDGSGGPYTPIEKVIS